MSNRRTDHDFESDDLLMNEEFDDLDDAVEDEEQEERSVRARAFNMDMRHRIEDRLEERRLKKELNEYEFFDLDDDEILH
ncbi:hypothetical protein A11A3_06320 [Alcanivorax hongdengensis A-11-3]|uniref:Leucyl-tRNA synthetase n=1 Tax=Alcanivorax hongdengensis A-11-3 TaxID=1177179 RepID=L0WG77_9GAMM|nr:hypothetical protein [Alcanivorax hongdengensis]EKF74825.1 hypothetical protein A11A3_06320 [Alcanivorax hongdengensis A-11-3]